MNTGAGTFGTPPLAAPGVLTLTGAGAANGVIITSTPSSVGSIAGVDGRLQLGNFQNIITVNPYVILGSNDAAPLQAGLNIEGIIDSPYGYTLKGNGVLGLAGQQLYEGLTDVNAGTVQVAVTNGGSRFSDYQLDANGKLDLSGTSTAIGSLTGTGTVFSSDPNTSTTTTATLQVGFDNSNFAFGGQFTRFNDALAGTLLLQKVGTGTMELTAQAAATSSTGTMTINQGAVKYDGAGTGAFSTYAVNASGSLVLDDSGTNFTNAGSRLGAAASLTLSGNLTMVGNGSAATSETIGTLTVGATGGGRAVITLQQTSGQSLTLTASTLAAIVAGDSMLLRGDNLGTVGGANLAVTTFNTVSGQGGGANGTTTMTVRPDIIGDTSSTGVGLGFVTKDSVTGFLRPLTAAEMATTLINSATTNFFPHGAGVDHRQSIREYRDLRERRWHWPGQSRRLRPARREHQSDYGDVDQWRYTRFQQCVDQRRRTDDLE